MSYLKLSTATLPNLEPGETLAVLLDATQRVAVRLVVGRDPVTQCGIYQARARAIDATGLTQCDSQGEPIVSHHTHTMTADVVTTIGEFVVLAQLALLMLGEPAPLIAFSAEVRRDASIRTALSSAARMGTPNLGGLL